jgi:penicillin-binding protein 1B
MPKKNKKKTSKSKKKSLSLGRLFIKLVIFVAVIGGTGLFGLGVYLNKRIEQRLNAGKEIEGKGIYADTILLKNTSVFTPDRMLKMLERRGYLPVEKEPGKGEFFRTEEFISFRTRNWTNDQLEEKGGELGQFEVLSGVVKNLSNPEKEFIVLEPELITTGETGDIRSSRHKNLSDFPKNLRNAVIAIEDERFYSHFGLDVLGISRAIFTNLSAGHIVQGGSTITQQLAKNLFFTPKRSLARKISEAVAAVMLELKLSKNQILEMYLNEIYLGQVGPIAIHGMGEASQSFFQKDVSDLTLAESATMAGLIKAPSYFSPRKHPKRANSRKITVLEKMKELDFIPQSSFKTAKAEQITVYPPARKTHMAPYFVTALRKELNASMNLEAALSNHASIYTGLQLEMQECGEVALKNGLAQLKDHYLRMNKDKELQGGLISIDVATKKIRAWVGGADYTVNQFDHVYQAKRQVGSTIKPFVYLTALDPSLNSYKVATAISLLSDKPLSIDVTAQPTWEPKNYSKEFYGDVTLRYAFENSLNIPAAYIGQKVGPEAMARAIQSFGVAKEVLAVPSLALGAIDTTLLNLTNAYAALANGGIYSEPMIFSSVRNPEQIFLSGVKTEQRVASEDAVYVMTDLMMGVVERGTAKSIRTAGYNGPAAGKTGTSNESRDTWFIGFSPDIVTGVWIGYDDNSQTGLTGGLAAAPIWAEYMKCIDPFHETMQFIPPVGVTFLDVDYGTASRALPGCKSKVIAREVFINGTEPLSVCDGGLVEQAPRFDQQPAEDSRKRRKNFWDILFR